MDEVLLYDNDELYDTPNYTYDGFRIGMRLTSTNPFRRKEPVQLSRVTPWEKELQGKP